MQAQTKFVATDVFGMNYWIENKGQFPINGIPQTEILFVYEHHFCTYVIGKSGIYYILKKEKESPANGRFKSFKRKFANSLDFEANEEDEKAHNTTLAIFDTTIVFQKFIGANSSAMIKTSGFSPHYFTNGIESMLARGYQKIEFENFYPNIDFIVEIAPENKGISYHFQMHLGADVSKIQFRYETIQSTNEEAISTVNSNNSITVHSKSISIQENGLKLILPEGENAYSVKYVQNNGNFQFQLENRNLQPSSPAKISTLPFDFIIDPFVSAQANSFYLPQLKTEHIVTIDYDVEGNIYLYGGALGFVHKMAKYNKNGLLLWTFTGAPPMQYIKFNPGSFGNIRVDRYSGKVYMMPGSGPPAFARVTTDGFYDHYWSKPTNTIEVGDLQFNPKFKAMVMYQGLITKNTVLYDVVDTFPEPIGYSVFTNLKQLKGRDYINAVIDDHNHCFGIVTTGTYFDTATFLYSNRIIGINDSMTQAKWTSFWGFNSFLEFDNNVIQAIRYSSNIYSNWYRSNHFKCLAVYDQFLYVYDGKHISAIDKLTGKVLARDSVPANLIINTSGISVDSCNHVYLGGDSTKVYVYQFDGTKFTYQKTLQIFKNKPNRVYDIQYNYDEHLLYVSGDSFIAAISCETPCGNKIRLTTSSLRSCGDPLWVKINNPDSLLTYTFEWRNDKTNEKVQSTTRKGKISDSLIQPKIDTDYKLYILINQFGIGTFKTVKFTVRHSFDSSCKYDICEGDTLSINGKKIYQSSQFTDTLKTYFGCDSIIDYNVIKHLKSRSTQSVHRCFGDTVVFNKYLLTANGIYFDTVKNAVGCDSFMKMQVFFQTDTAQFSDTICNRDTFYFHKQKITSAGAYFEQVTDTAGCKYIERQQITVLLDSGFQKINICDGDTFLSPGNKKYFAQGHYLDTLISSKNCDSILHTEITLLSPSFKGRKLQFCKGDSLFLAGRWRFKPGIFIDTLINAVGCDSVLQTETVLFPNRDSSASVFLCNEDSVIFKGKTYLLPTKILERLKDKNGCDSVFQLSVRNSSVTAKFSIDSANKPEFIFINESSTDSAINWKVDQEKQDAPAIPFQYKFEPKGQYHQVCLEAINSDGCKDTFCVNVYASKIAYKLYNVFTPNADGKNDLLAIDYIGGNFKYDVAIFNRWGELIYEAKQAWASDPTQLWNGKVNNVGAECPSGTYFALFNFYIGEGSKPIFTEIPVTLIRTP